MAKEKKIKEFIILDENREWRCEFDVDNWKLEHLVKAQTKEGEQIQKWVFVGYYGQLVHIIERMVDVEVALNNDVKKLYSKLEKMIADVTNVMITGKEKVIVKEKEVQVIIKQYYEIFPEDKRKKPKLHKTEKYDSNGKLISTTTSSDSKKVLF